jgi:hypothetical protein
MATTLKDFNTSVKLSLSFFLLSIVIGTISALIMLGLLLTHEKSGFQIPTVENIKVKYHYPALVSAMKGSMYQYVADDEDITAVLKWVKEGATKEAYEESIAPIMNTSCVSCHNPTSTMSGAMPGLPLTSYEEVHKYSEPGYSWTKMSKQAHVHLFGIGAFLVIVTLIFAFSSFRPWFRNLLICTSWVALLLDVLCWWLTKYELSFAYIIVGAGAAMSGSAIGMSFLALLDMWIVVPWLTTPATPAAKTPDGGA